MVLEHPRILQNVTHILHPFPVCIGKLKGAPQNLLCDSSVVPNCCNMSIEGISGLEEQVDGLRVACQCLFLSKSIPKYLA